MTKKDYIKIANVLKALRGDSGAHVRNQTLDVVARELGIVMAEDNPMFNSDRFMAACK